MAPPNLPNQLPRSLKSAILLPAVAQAAACIVLKFGQQRRGVAFHPSPPDLREDRFAVRRHFLNENARRSRFFMPRAPYKQFQKHRREADPFFREAVINPPFIRRIFLWSNNSRCLEPAQTACENISSYPLARFLEVFECAKPANHQIADDQERPTVAKLFQGDAHRAAGTPPGF